MAGLPDHREEDRPPDRYALIIGGSRGIGAETARLFACNRYNVAITYNKSRERALETLEKVRECNPHGSHHAFKVDVRLYGDVEELARRIEGEYPYLNVLVYSAGILQLGGIEELEPREWREVIDTNLTGAYYATKALLSSLRRAPWASIVYVSSIAGESGNVVAGPAYAASKAGLIGLAKRLAVELAGYGIRVNTVAPSFVETDMTRQFLDTPEKREKVRNLHPLRIILQPRDVANAILFLADPVWSRGITGHTLSINAGRRT